jgi:lysyl-tRNA synthetase class 2
MELYQSYKDYNRMMNFTEELLEKVALDSNGTTELDVWGHKVSFKAPFRRLSMIDAIKEYTGVDITGMGEDDLRKVCDDLHIETDETMGVGKLIDEIFGEKCEANLIQPTFITDYPKEMSPLTKEHRSNPDLTERFELIVCGKELANAYSELNDPIDQRERFEDQLKLTEKGDDEAMFIDQDYLRALEYAMPPTSGIGIGIDRLVMMMTDNSSIQEVLFFPQMKPEKQAPTVELKDNEKAIFEIVQKNEGISLADLKEQAGLSNKGWDKGMKGLSKHGLIQVDGDAKTVSLK